MWSPNNYLSIKYNSYLEVFWRAGGTQTENEKSAKFGQNGLCALAGIISERSMHDFYFNEKWLSSDHIS